MKRFFLLFALLSGAASAQEIPIYHTYDDFKKEWITNDDTLYVINFWATWCGPCIKELPHFETLYQKTQGQNVKIILLSLDFKSQIDTKLKAFVKRKKYSSTIVALTDKNYNDWLEKVDPQWSGAIPATLLIKGNKHSFQEKEFSSYEELNAFIQQFNNS